MSAILNFAIFPTDKGDKGSSEYVSKVLKMIDESGVSYKLNPMGTSIETETFDEALAIVSRAYKILEPVSQRVYCAMTVDIRKNRTDGMSQKINSIENKIGKVRQ
jgi:uncharacterized protein (TIGR00106 family)